MSSNDSTGKTLLVASLLCIVCSIVVSTAAVALKGEQVKNKLLDKNKNILAAAGMLEEGKSVQEIFEQRLEVKLVNLDTGEYLTEETATEEWQKAALENPVAYDQRKAAKTKGQNEILGGSEDIASIKRQAQYATVYLAKNKSGEVETIILPVHGYGLWSTLYGFLALETDATTVVGLGFYEHGETPGLGGEVDNPKWKSMWPGKEVFDDEGDVAIRLVKGSVDPKAANVEHKVDGLAGATLTSNGVTNLLQFWLGENGFGQYLAKVKEQGV
jgi:Na+-transporting NADH:ubiquinone oxidoreductase subunit C